MKSGRLRSFLALLAVSLVLQNETGQAEGPKATAPTVRLPIAGMPPKRPNIIFILMDDLGYGDIGKFWQNRRRTEGLPSFQTPHWDQMADEGMMLMQHYCAVPVCAPSRASLMLGQTQGHCALRNDEFDIALPEDYTMAGILKQEGYATMAVGKWGLAGIQAPWTRPPSACGFDYFYGYLKHISGKEHYPGNNGSVSEGITPVTSGLDLAYTTDLWTAKAKQLIENHEAKKPDQPFFMYLAYETPHSKLEAPTQAYPPGEGLHGGIQWPLNTNSGVKNSYIYPEMVHAPWPTNAKIQATMIRRDDECVGDVLQLLRDLKIDKNTLVVLTSDNGPMGEQGESPTYFGSWGPFDGMKRDIYEGGIHMPCIAWWPSHIAAGSSTQVVSGLWDWLPTFAEAGGQLPPGSCDGISLLPALLGEGRQATHPYLYFEYLGVTFHENGAEDFFKRKGLTGRGQEQGVRLDDYMGLRYQIVDPNQPLRLYNLKDDIHEDHDIAANPDSSSILERMNPLLLTARDNVSAATRPYSNQLLPAEKVAKTAPGLIYETYQGTWPWVPDFKALSELFTPSSEGLEPLFAPNPGMDDQSYVTVAHGYVNVPSDGEYGFTLQEDGGGHLWIHDAHVISDDYQHNASEHLGSLFLKAGLHPIRVIYRHKPGQAYLTVNWFGPGAPGPNAIPAKDLVHEP